jgi:hypothetical protein
MYKSTMEKQNQFGGVRVHSYDLWHVSFLVTMWQEIITFQMQL